jgi:hypothetical protein
MLCMYSSLRKVVSREVTNESRNQILQARVPTELEKAYWQQARVSNYEYLGNG